MVNSGRRRTVAKAGGVVNEDVGTRVTTGLFDTQDYLALGFFVAAWFGYHLAVERGPASGQSLNTIMNGQRVAWMREMATREARMVDTMIMSTLQNGTAFFASTSLIAVGGTLALLQATDTMIQLFTDLPFGIATTRAAVEAKIVGLAIIFVYAFFKFAWSYRIFNYAAILVGATPMPARNDPGTLAAADRAAAMVTAAGRHFNRGQRAFFFAVAYLGWFLGPYIMMGATAAILYAMWRRQFHSDAWMAVARSHDGGC